MPPVVVTGGMISCSMALVPAPVPIDTAVPPTLVTAGGLPVGTIMHSAPLINIPTFGMCNSPSNPVVIAATAAALGVHTPAPCIPATAAPWAPGALTVRAGGLPVLTEACTLMCMWAGEITVESPGQVMVEAT